jgi:hypothetical protein
MGPDLISPPPPDITALVSAANTFKFKPLHKEVSMIKTGTDVHMCYEFWFW